MLTLEAVLWGMPHFFLLKVAALETVMKLSKSRCPCVWRGLQSLQVLVLPQLKWVQRWAAFRVLVKSMQVLSRPLFVFSIATIFTDELECSDGTSDHITDSRDSEIYAAEPSPVQDNLNIRVICLIEDHLTLTYCGIDKVGFANN